MVFLYFIAIFYYFRYTIYMKTLLKLQEKLGDSVQENIDLSQYSTFKLGGPAKYFFVAKTSDDITKACRIAKKLKLEIFLLAGGSNLLIADNGFDGLVIKAENRNIELINENNIKTEGGVVWNEFVNFAKENSFTGIEWGAGIPGTIGGAVRGNAGAFGQSVHQIIKTVEVLNSANLEIKNFQNSECEFDYRDSVFKQNKNLIILSSIFELQKGDKQKIADLIKKNLQYRDSTQPCLPSAGCIFKNIIVTDEILAKLSSFAKAAEDKKDIEKKIKGGKIGSAFIIDKAGLKGYVIGGVKVSDEHANFIVKISDDAKSDHVLQLISYIKQQVRDNYGIQLQEEVQYVGF